jgi:flagellar L-ring protein FlgH
MSDAVVHSGSGPTLVGQALLSCLLAFLVAVPASAETAAPKQTAAQKKDAAQKAQTDNYDELLAHYLQAARAAGNAQETSIDWMTGLTSDRRARHVNDLVTIRVVENIVAIGTADSSLTKKSSANAGVPSLLGLESKLPSAINPSNLVTTSSASDFKGGGQTNRSSELTATMTARVAEVLPNGDLVLEGIREIEINGDRQVVVLTGVARPTDVTPQNVVFSTQVGQLRIRYFGKGLMKDNLKPGLLVRILNKIF